MEDLMTTERNKYSYTGVNLTSTSSEQDERRAKLLEQARREVPVLREQVAADRAALRRIAKS